METIERFKEDGHIKLYSKDSIEFPIESNGMQAKVIIYPGWMGYYEFESLAQEIKQFHETFWNMGNEVNWDDCFENNNENENYVVKYFLGCRYIKPVGEWERIIYKDFPSEVQNGV